MSGDENPTRHEALVALHVTDEDTYADYRACMTPILHAKGGFFRRDYRISESLAGGDPAVNRVFVLSFPTEKAMGEFFGDADYQAVRAEFFEPSVAHTDIIASYDIAAG